MSYERIDCRLCGEPVETQLKLADTPIANLFPDKPMAGEFYPLELRECIRCHHVQIGHVIPDSMLYGASYKYETPTALRPQFEKRAKELRSDYPEARNVLEIGANNGLFLHALSSAGFKEVVGIDPSTSDPLVWKMPFDSNAAVLVHERVGDIDLIVANNVFAHLDDLRAMFAAIEIVLSGSGTLVFEVQYFISMRNAGAFDMIYHEHRDYHTLRPMAEFLRSAGFVMTGYEHIDAQGGSLRITAKRNGIEAVLPREFYYWQGFRHTIETEKKRFSMPRWKVPAFGAPAKAVTLIHHFGLQDKISYCVDDTPCKQGRYIAGTAIPVVGRDVMEKENPERMLMLSWNYEPMIRRMFPAIEFIVPFSQRHKLAA